MSLLPFLLLLAADDEAAPGAEAEEALVRQTRAAVESLVRTDEFSGVVLLDREGVLLLHEAWGLANRELGRPNTLETRFNLGSITKLFTGVLVARQVEAGRIGWEDPLTDHLDPPPQRAIDDRIRLHHLLTHSSGLGDFWDAWERAPRGEVRDLESYLALTRNDRLRFAPGSAVRYSNVAVLVLGQLLEELSQRDYYELAEETLFRPLGMERTDFGLIDPTDPTRAVGYQRLASGRLRDASEKNPIRGSPAGGTFSTAADLCRFLDALRGGRILEPATLERLTTRHLDLDEGVGYGYLCMVLESRGVRRWGHDGGSEGVNAELWYYPDQGLTVVVLANVDHGADRVAASIHRSIAELWSR